MTSPRSRVGFTTFCILVALVSGRPAGAFHEEGVAACRNCHIMHNSEQGQPVVDGGTGEWLLRAESPSDLCLGCHATSLGSVLGPDPLNPPLESGAGNFVFLFEDNLNDGPDGAVNPIGGDRAGHNINAPAHGLAADGTIAHSPGGSYPARLLGCTSCHDPHGNGNFRMLRGAGNEHSWESAFLYAAPAAVGLDVTASPTETPTSHTAYHDGMSRWCGNCHEGYLTRHNRNASAFSHRTATALGGNAVSWYNAYNGTSDPAGGDAATAYLPEVPFEDYSVTTSSTLGPTFSSGMMCLSCHRAHASSGPASGRWDFRVSLLLEDGVNSGSYPIPSPYPDPDQAPLCQKCHDRLP